MPKDGSPSQHIVVIDDDITSLDIISFLFENRGFKVHRCADGASAIEYLKNVDPDLLIVDLMMPQLNGVDTVKEIRGLGFATLPILAFTAVDDPALHEEARQAGCNEVLTKPCNAERLLKQVRRFLDLEGPAA
jgi:CheY-like chemotaxis protein